MNSNVAAAFDPSPPMGTMLTLQTENRKLIRMANEHDHLLDAAVALDAGIGRRSARIGEAGELPEDVTEVPHERDVTASRGGGTEADGDR
ncbi:hypothetical protein [Ensifer sp. B1-9]|uniref:hypothetical protein n=1 Tax=Ensifer sp. B1-9 TaxID=3141455 RepID=UPI003D21EFD3